MTGEQERWTTVDDFFAGVLLGEEDPVRDQALADALRASEDAGLPDIQVSALQGKLLHLLVRALRARRVLELGTLGGYSTIWMASALPADGRLVSCDIDPHHAHVARDNLRRAGLADRVEVRVGPAMDSLRELAAAGVEPFDVVFIDADKPGYPDYLTGSLRLSRPGTMILADNVVRRGRVADAGDEDANVVGVRRFAEQVGATPGLSATVIQTVGAKGYDGLLLAVVGPTGPAVGTG